MRGAAWCVALLEKEVDGAVCRGRASIITEPLEKRQLVDIPRFAAYGYVFATAILGLDFNTPSDERGRNDRWRDPSRFSPASGRT
jgi:hypothetical protein